MFSNLFGKKESGQPDQLFKDRAYMTSHAKMKACADLARTDVQLLFIAWFSETANRFREYFKEQGIAENRIIEAAKLPAAALHTQKPVFVEHYPLHSKETAFVSGWDIKNIPVYSAMDEPLFKHFGSEKIIPMMKLMGMKEHEVIEHDLVSKSIVKGQQKIEEQVPVEQQAVSQEAWMKKNLA